MLHQAVVFCQEEVSDDEAQRFSEAEQLEWLESPLDEDDLDFIPFWGSLPTWYTRGITEADDYGLEARF